MKLKQIKQKGFTMIELVIVIAILGILAAFALPRFANFSTNARNSASQSIAGTLNASLGIVKAKYVAGGATGNTVNLDGKVIPVTNTGDLKLDTIDDCEVVFNLTNLVRSEYGTNFTTYSDGTKQCSVFSYKNRGTFYLTPSSATSAF
jgi:prepilin-type N-terminal cleavage/methylation domain-containing protein